MTRMINIFLIGIITILIAAIMALTISSTLEKPGTCGFCHKMEPYVSSYLEPARGSVLLKHKLGCIDCHTNTTTSKARKSPPNEINVHILNEITGLKLNITRKDLAADCTRCHIMEDYIHLNSTQRSTCESCHWAHSPPISSNPVRNATVVLIPRGPHRNQTCSSCHGTDFQSPRCTNCHEGHGEQKLENDLCLGCHMDPHTPEKPGKFPGYSTRFKGKLPFETCQPCHENEYFEVKYSSSRHTEMQTCTLCHDTHGKIQGCEGYHYVMEKQQHPDFACPNCHKNLPESVVSCFDCHGRRVHDLTSSSAQWNPK